jgi:cytochrome c-type biogenesis protein CcmF
MIELGRYCLLAGLALSGYGAIAAGIAGRRKNLALARSAENSLVAAFVIVVAASACLIGLLMTDEFRVQYVASYSASNIPTVYKFTAFWGGQAGSLLMWALVLAFFCLVAVIQNRNRNRKLMPYATAVMAGILCFFMILLTFATNPFNTFPGAAPPDGNGLNPLLQNSYMVIHPPILYLGYIGLTIPFAFAMAALMSRKLDTSWIRVTRRWTLVAWIFLTMGFTLGGIWAYEELGWGGYWAWDPVENSSFMPWLFATAFLHSIMITEKKGMLKLWNFILVLVAFELSIFGTFVTRSGVISSVHSFALSNLGPMFAGFLLLSTLFGVFWIVRRSDQLRSEQRMKSFLSREATFLLNNLLFVSICFAIFWGTVFPIISEWVQGEKITVSAPFFNKVTWPLALTLLVLTGICPLIAWRKASFKNFRRNFLIPLTGGMLAGGLALFLGVRSLIPLLFYSACGFVAFCIFFEFYKGARARQGIRSSSFLVALKDLTLMNKRRYGGFIIHIGVTLVFVGIIASSFFSQEKLFNNVQEGEEFSFGSYSIVFQKLDQRSDPEKNVVRARLQISQAGETIGELQPEKHFHHKGEQPMTEVAIRRGWREDLYVVLSEWDDQRQATLHLFINPLVSLIWVGIGIMVCGGLFVVFPNKRPGPAVALSTPSQEPKDEAA